MKTPQCVKATARQFHAGDRFALLGVRPYVAALLASSAATCCG